MWPRGRWLSRGQLCGGDGVASGHEWYSGCRRVTAELHLQWQRSKDGGNNWAVISRETDASYTLGQDDVGAKVRVVVSFTDALGGQETLESDPTAAVQPCSWCRLIAPFAPRWPALP